MQVLGATAVQEGYLSLGSFLILMNSVSGFGTSLEEVGKLLTKMVIGCAAVKKISYILNQDMAGLSW